MQQTVIPESTAERIGSGRAMGWSDHDRVPGLLAIVATLILAKSLHAQIDFENGALLDVTSPESVCVGDFDHDGHLDLAAASVALNTIVTFAGDGDGTFDVPRFVDWLDRPTDLTTADIDGDGNLDLVATSFLYSTIGIAYGDGAGHFATPVYYDVAPVGTSPESVTTGDLNGDDWLDIIVAFSGGAGGVVVFWADGAGGFLAPVVLFTQASASYVVAADINADGRLDLATTSSGSSTFGVAYGYPGGIFPSYFAYTIGIDDSLWYLSATDLDGNGLLDLVIPCPNANLIAVYFNDIGVFGSATMLETGEFPIASCVQDINDDGYPDIISAAAGSDEIVVNAGSVAGDFADPTAFNSAVSSITVAAGDFDDDGRIDVVVAHSANNLIRVHLNRSQPGTFDVLRGDVDGDGSLGIGDPIQLLDHLFGAGEALACSDAADLDDDGLLGIGDAIGLLCLLFDGSGTPPVCAPDLTDDTFPPCTVTSCP